MEVTKEDKGEVSKNEELNVEKFQTEKVKKKFENISERIIQRPIIVIASGLQNDDSVDDTLPLEMPLEGPGCPLNKIQNQTQVVEDSHLIMLNQFEDPENPKFVNYIDFTIADSDKSKFQKEPNFDPSCSILRSNGNQTTVKNTDPSKISNFGKQSSKGA